MVSAPSPPDPKETANAQSQMNRETAMTQQQLNMINQVTPYGSLTYSQTGQNFMPTANGQTYYYNSQTGEYRSDAPMVSQNISAQQQRQGMKPNLPYNRGNDSTGALSPQSRTQSSLDPAWQAVQGIMNPSYTATQTLSPEQQRILEQSQGAQFNLASLANQQSDFLKEYLSKGLDLSGAPELVSSFDKDWSADRQRVEDALFTRMQPQLDQDQNSLRTTLINQGIRPGTAAWDAEWNRNQQGVNDARTAVLLAGGQEQSRLAGLDQAAAAFQNNARNQYIAEQYAQRNQPINEITALLGGSQVQQPNFVSTPQTGVAGVDYTGLVNQKYQAEVANSQAAMGGMFGLLSSGIGLLSDRRTKRDIRRVGTLDNGLPVYRYRYAGENEVQIGLMADEVEKVHPEAVSTGADGYKRVRYDLAVEAL